MKLSGGTLRNRTVSVPKSDALRPTPGRVKEALFSILGDAVRGARMLDLYAGSGAIGFESLSRGAAEAVFVEKNPRLAASIRLTAAALAVSECSNVIVATALRAAHTVTGRFDFVYADPPYADEPPRDVFEALLGGGRVDSASILVYERRSRAGRPLHSSSFATFREARYGEVHLEFMRPL